jgi:hypothetical protein
MEIVATCAGMEGAFTPAVGDAVPRIGAVLVAGSGPTDVGEDRLSNIGAYGDPALPLAAGLTDALGGFLGAVVARNVPSASPA